MAGPGADDDTAGGFTIARRGVFAAAAVVAAATGLASTASAHGAVLRAPVPGSASPRAGLAMPPATLPPTDPTPPSVEDLELRAEARDATTRVARSSGPLQLVAVTWTGPTPDTVELRSTDAAGRWGAWLPLDAVASDRDDQPERAADGGGGTDPVWVGDRTAVEVRALRGGEPVTEGLAVRRIDPGTAGNDVAIGARARERNAARTTPPPAYVTRAQWGADESLMTWPAAIAPTLRAVTIHHTAESNDYSPEQSAAIVRGIYAYHSKSNGWGDIGYNALVDKYGTIFEGRAGGFDRPVTAAHAGGFNQETWGIALMGNLSTTWPTPPQGQSVAALSAWKLGGMYRDPGQRIQLTSSGGGTSKFAKGRQADVPALFAHRDVGNTSCPGDLGYASMDSLRRDVSKLIAESAVDVRIAWMARGPNLGEPTRTEAPTADGRGRYQDFRLGSIYWSPETGAHQVAGPIRDAWRAQGAERSPLGLPVGEEHAVAGSRVQAFEHGVMRLNTRTGAVSRV